jgi:serine/threonine-protein kinase
MPQPTEPPHNASKYRPIVELGRGGMADVFLAVVQGQAGFNKLVVVKKMRPELGSEPEVAAMFLDEARLAARLSHPNVVQTYEVGQEDEQYFIAMEYLDGQPLNRIRQRSASSTFPPFPLPLQIRVLADVLAGLHHAHELADFDGTKLSVVHRDATPHNVFVTYDGHVKVVDFGIAKASGASSETRAGVMKGKIAYMPPEQVRCLKLDRRADIFAVGVMLWEAIAETRMWKGLDELTILPAVAEGRIPDILAAAPDAAPELVRITRRALAPDPRDRHATATEMQTDLENYLDTLDVRASAREIGKYVSERFATQRAGVKRIVEAQLSDVHWSGPAGGVPGSLPRLDNGPASSLRPSGAPRSSEIPEPSSASRTDSAMGVALPTKAPPPSLGRTGMTTLPSAQAAAAAPLVGPAAAADAAAAPAAPPAVKRGKAPLFVALLAAVALLGFGFVATRSGRPTGVSASPVAPEAAPIVPTAVAAPPLAEVASSAPVASAAVAPSAAASTAPTAPAGPTIARAIVARPPAPSTKPKDPASPPTASDRDSFGGRK